MEITLFRFREASVLDEDWDPDSSLGPVFSIPKPKALSFITYRPSVVWLRYLERSVDTRHHPSSSLHFNLSDSFRTRRSQRQALRLSDTVMSKQDNVLTALSRRKSDVVNAADLRLSPHYSLVRP